MKKVRTIKGQRATGAACFDEFLELSRLPSEYLFNFDDARVAREASLRKSNCYAQNSDLAQRCKGKVRIIARLVRGRNVERGQANARVARGGDARLALPEVEGGDAHADGQQGRENDFDGGWSR